MTKEEFLANTYGSIVDIKGNTQDIIKLMFQPVTLDSMAEGKIDVGNKRSIASVTFEVINDAETEIIFTAGENSVFCVNFPNKLFLFDKEVKVISNKNYGMAHINEATLCYQGMTGLTGNGSMNSISAIDVINNTYGLDVVDLTGTFAQYDGFEEMKKSYFDMKEKNGIPDHAVPVPTENE